MPFYMYWLLFGVISILLEFVVPGGIVVFLGVAAVVVGGLLYFGWITSWVHALIAWFLLSLFLMLFLRSVFIAYFEGDTSIGNVDEDEDLVDSVVEVIEPIFPYKDGRVRFRDSSWRARSEEELEVGKRVKIVRREGGTLIVGSF